MTEKLQLASTAGFVAGAILIWRQYESFGWIVFAIGIALSVSAIFFERLQATDRNFQKLEERVVRQATTIAMLQDEIKALSKKVDRMGLV